MDDNKKRNDNQEQLESHSLPGTNQAGKGPGRGNTDEKDLEKEPAETPPDQTNHRTPPKT